MTSAAMNDAPVMPIPSLADYLSTLHPKDLVKLCVEANDAMNDLRARAEAAEAESARLTEALTAMVSAKALQNVRSIVAGWNGEGRPDGPYERRHPANLGAKIETNCGAFYELDEAMQKARAALNP